MDINDLIKDAIYTEIRKGNCEGEYEAELYGEYFSGSVTFTCYMNDCEDHEPATFDVTILEVNINDEEGKDIRSKFIYNIKDIEHELSRN